MIVFCDDDTCYYNDGTACRAPNIEIKVGTGSREDGTTGTVNICSDYRSKDDVRM